MHESGIHGHISSFYMKSFVNVLFPLKINKPMVLRHIMAKFVGLLVSLSSDQIIGYFSLLSSGTDRRSVKL